MPRARRRCGTPARGRYGWLHPDAGKLKGHRSRVSPFFPRADLPEGPQEDGIELPPTPRPGEEAHTDAVEHLTEARERQRHLVDRAEAAEGTSGEEQASDALETVRHEVAAREAWVVWTERGI